MGNHCMLCLLIQPKAQEDLTYKEIPVGVILDMGSWVGKTVHSCITIALSEFYKVHNHYETRIVVHNRDTQGETLHALHTVVIAGEKLQSNLSRFVVSVWMFVVLVLVSSYTATLSSLLTVEQIKLASKGSSIGYYPIGSSMHEFMVRNFDVTRLKPYFTAEEYADALSRGSKKGGVVAIVDEIPFIKEFLTQYPSGYYMTMSEATASGFGFAFLQGSPLSPEISRQITRLREDGTLKMLEDKWFNYQQSGPHSNDSAPKILNLQGLRGLFLISGVSMAAALFIFMLYLVHEKIHFTYTILAGGKLGFIIRLIVRKIANAIGK